jgi:hypothetical protein
MGYYKNLVIERQDSIFHATGRVPSVEEVIEMEADRLEYLSEAHEDRLTDMGIFDEPEEVEEEA